MEVQPRNVIEHIKNEAGFEKILERGFFLSQGIVHLVIGSTNTGGN